MNLAARTGAHHYLAVFGKHTHVPLYLGRARRTATAGQRLVLFARDRGCTRPGCTAPASRCQAHHAAGDWQHDGHTDITNLALACGPDNRLATDGGWHTTMTNGRVHWHPPPLLDTGQPRTNRYHHPQLYPPDDSADNGGEDGETDSPTSWLRTPDQWRTAHPEGSPLVECPPTGSIPHPGQPRVRVDPAPVETLGDGVEVTIPAVCGPAGFRWH